MTNQDENAHRLDTEQSNPRSDGLDRLDTEAMLRVINSEDRSVPEAVASAIPDIAAIVERAGDAIRAGGHLHYFGAGTSGRLGVLDASEMPPTFGVTSDLVQGHIAGGDVAIRHPVEGAEDSLDAGRRAVEDAGVTSDDVVVALSASGGAPYCIGVLERARELGAFTGAIVCNADTPLHDVADRSVTVRVGPEVLTGSTRLKAGTAQKLVLNMISTGAMVRVGFTYGNLMVGLTPTNTKLRDRARRLVRTITGLDDPESVLEACGWDVRTACIAVSRGLAPEAAAAHLSACDGSLRRALE
ncbi:MAG: N-acetylmuramic acid 6-phosphate etherase [Planctomycetes bacterium]|nr:N-acetylmuramic acid 6-phosphate etherase [Planctomycetota bacterium]